MNAEVRTIIGVMLLLFGISWTAYANTQPLAYCPIGPPGPFGCLDYTATVFYPLGFLAMVVGVVILAWDHLPSAQK
jgi:hypothetical protein